MRSYAIYQLDAFTATPFGGNPAGVVPDARGLTEEAMRLIAREMNVSETAFVFPSPRADFRVRFFTPAREVDLCGHATIATFWLLAVCGRLPAGRTRFTQETGAGILPVEVSGRPGHPQRVMMAQAPPQVLGEVDPAEVAPLLGADPAGLARTGLPLQVVSTGLPDLLVPLPSLAALHSLRPDHARLAAWCRARDIVSVHAFCFETVDPAALVHTRDFAPAAGIPEEAATGTANGALGAYLALNRAVAVPPASPDGTAVLSFLAEQGHILGRESRIEVEVDMHLSRVEGVRVGGQAVEVLRGTVTVPELPGPDRRL
ncbi:MAG: PhzF family phenazine biosynthesis protein [bacterium]|nr:PhzF family phenazine biosynthesis protein [bacterium]